MILRNAHVDDFQDSEDAWPPRMDLEGFRYDRLGGFIGAGSDDMRQRSPEEWTDWLERDPTFSTQPYTELSSGAGECSPASRLAEVRTPAQLTLPQLLSIESPAVIQ
jgi:hypothetical protein